MTEDDSKNLPKNPIEAQGLLIKAIYQKFGKESLPVIQEVCAKQGRSLGLKMKNRLKDTRLSSVATAFTQNFNPDMVEVVSVSDNRFHIKGNKCPFGLENTSRELCEAVMSIDHEYFRAAVNEGIELAITKTVAAGDTCCETIYNLPES